MVNQVEFLYSKFLECQGVSIDTRTLRKDNLFFGINGENSNGCEYAKQALEKGAKYVVIDDPKFAGDERVILVDDTLVSLQELATFHREKFPGKVLAITGSNGKTTTKELVREVLAQKYVVHATQGNFNNHLGVPLTLLQLTTQTEIAIIEMGASHIGEIARLCEIAQPSFGLITNVGQAHTEGFGGMEGVMRGKSELFDYLSKNEGVPFINVWDARINSMAKRFPNAIFFPSEDFVLENSKEFLRAKLGDRVVATNLTGDYNFPNAAAAVAVGRYFGVSEDEIANGLQEFKPENHRSQIIKKGTNTIILDAYNANPDSMRGALKNLEKFDGKKIAILGDMNELAHSDEAHFQLGQEIAIKNFDRVILVGEKIRPALEKLPEAKHFPTTERLREYLTEHSFENSVILLKASRSMKLEEVVDKL